MSWVERFYDRSAEREWARLTMANQPHHWLEYRVALHLMGKYLPPPTARVLDAGCGPGRYAVALARQGYRVTLFDLSAHCLELARQNAQEAGVAGQVEGYERGSAVDLGRFADGCFDAVLVMGPLYHLHAETDRRAVVRESLRVLRPGGVVVASIINHLGLLRSGLTEFVDDFATPWILELAHSTVLTIPESETAGFTDAYFAHPLELRRWYEDAGAQTVSMAAQEGVAGGLLDECRRLSENATAWRNYVRLVLETCEDPTILGGSEHALYIGRKPHHMSGASQTPEV